jgi:hypothetical protein
VEKKPAASAWPNDPRVCSQWVTSAHPLGSAGQRSDCAMHAAVATVRKHVGPAVISCTKLGSTLQRWLCGWGYANPIGYTTVFSKSKGH